jgi:hypothetical protein
MNDVYTIHRDASVIPWQSGYPYCTSIDAATFARSFDGRVASEMQPSAIDMIDAFANIVQVPPVIHLDQRYIEYDGKNDEEFPFKDDLHVRRVDLCSFRRGLVEYTMEIGEEFVTLVLTFVKNGCMKWTALFGMWVHMCRNQVVRADMEFTISPRRKSFAEGLEIIKAWYRGREDTLRRDIEWRGELQSVYLPNTAAIARVSGRAHLAPLLLAANRKSRKTVGVSVVETGVESGLSSTELMRFDEALVSALAKQKEETNMWDVYMAGTGLLKPGVTDLDRFRDTHLQFRRFTDAVMIAERT